MAAAVNDVVAVCKKYIYLLVSFLLRSISIFLFLHIYSSGEIQRKMRVDG
jgi:hypothetical protein